MTQQSRSAIPKEFSLPPSFMDSWSPSKALAYAQRESDSGDILREEKAAAAFEHRLVMEYKAIHNNARTWAPYFARFPCGCGGCATLIDIQAY